MLIIMYIYVYSIILYYISSIYTTMCMYMYLSSIFSIYITIYYTHNSIVYMTLYYYYDIILYLLYIDCIYYYI